MLNTILYNMGLYQMLYDEDYTLMKIKYNLKKTTTLKRTFYTPSKLEIQNKYHRFQLKKRPIINVNDIINTKKNLKQI